ncbi:tRNA (adenosine(37)-N6)-threonylcarbamoyltransferase complex ATPase subunit type 1 TsaE [Luteibaculum oceani]|uniref:tRNA threonylcarbamoyladenosine biosynthesis protein TsaE n=1 Tax=Luteibaculum oceani TaxID=1294296 RepID=A0A5C6V099_9FLAO|nr:tRNA (adenosine(37)-N6)-threonylcarbamoyltransferase complex ATPase subunit type 1 TsaE [Luteibaculum oceani]TXC78370.1 tRNA (adenosine(37)-N6)-threonylcarbamoyltransferase complex ATPase subunit type 1 TsaE [Luteibaculum oceani]
MRTWSNISLADLEDVALEISRIIKPGLPLLVNAEMGSGKTTFAAKLVKVLGGNELEVSSPTFSIIQSYPLADGGFFHHVDLYRIEDEEEFLDLDMDSYLGEKDFLYIEWPEMFDRFYDLPCHRMEIVKDNKVRSFRIK